MIDNFELEQLVEPLQEWFDGHARVLPWRENPVPYYVWISEIMLQQTRVEAVKPYFERFIREIPDVRALAECPEEKYLKLWEGLGYYNRVRNLNAAAQQIMSEYQGSIPSEYEELLKLKGIGHYTAGAISSIAYGQAVPAVDGNVLRVIARVTGDASDIMKQSVRNHFEERLQRMMVSMYEAGLLVPSKFNQGLMELGATVCVPNGEPHCGECPWKLVCRAYRENTYSVLPVKKKAKERRIEERTVLVIRDGDKVAIHKRPKKGLLAGLYELPNELGYLSQEHITAYIEKLGYLPLRIQRLSDAKHIFSHIEWHMRGYVVSVEPMEWRQSEHRQKLEPGQKSEQSDKSPKTLELIFVEAADARERYAIPTAFSKYAEYMNIPIGAEAVRQDIP